jgi:4-amino-4-deoxychorismate lyase
LPLRQDTLINGSFEDQLSVDNRGLQYGDGLFETVAVVNGQPCLWRRHMARLQASARRLRIALPDAAVLLAEAHRAIASAQRCVLKIIVTRAGEGRGYRAVPDLPGLRLLRVFPYPKHPPEFARLGVRVRLCTTPLGHSPALAGMKHLGRLEQVLARSEWHDATIAEGLMCDRDGRVIEGTQSNLFVELDGSLTTPDLGGAGVAGVVRGLVMDTAVAHGRAVIEAPLGIDDLREADALYLTNSLIGIWRIRAFEDRQYPLSGRIHPIIRSAMEQIFVP